MLVIDASATLYAAASRSGFRSLRRHDLVAPPLMWSEATSAIRERLYRGELSLELADRVRERLWSGSIARHDSVDVHRGAWDVAEKLGWARTYDAEYVALADLLGCRLLTMDERLKRGAGHLVEIVGPTEL
jgi:predicted nucleic acid-binding protein